MVIGYYLRRTTLGPRFYDWQLAQSGEESWEECERHVEIIKKILPRPNEETKTVTDRVDVAVDLFGDPVETDLFGAPLYSKARKR